jgi:hypothetical protein
MPSGLSNGSLGNTTRKPTASINSNQPHGAWLLRLWLDKKAAKKSCTVLGQKVSREWSDVKKRFLAMSVLVPIALVACPATPPVPQGTELILNGSFENGIVNWQTFAENNGIAEQGKQKYCAKTGDAYGALGGVGKNATLYARSFFKQNVLIPATGTTTLSYSLRIDTLEPDGSDKDTFTAFIDDSGIGKTIKTTNPRNVHTTYIYDLSAEKGKTITLKFEAFNNESLNTVFCLDDVSVKHSP